MVRRKPVNTAQFTIRLPQDLKDNMMRAAELQGIDTNSWLRNTVRKEIERQSVGYKNRISSEVREELMTLLYDSEIKKHIKKIIEE